ncbi:GGDEF domain-containing protein [Symbioplanes lichenis]|uniref:GGDEF domain-containing protein n=1 Tax=Symbioplanes lichenis TaxID=1629072 RepID=UPI0027382CF1|nr:GGDEF domain-containing protein [Actinoplanes lichenis]
MERPTRADPILAALVTLLVVSVPAFGFGHAAAATQVGMFWTLMATVQTAAVALSWQIARLTRTRRPERRLFESFAATAGVLVLGDLVQLGATFRDPLSNGAINGTGAQLVLIVVAIVVLLHGLLRFPLASPDRAERRRLAVDAATVMAAATTVSLWTFTLPDGPHSVGWAVTLAASLLVQPGLFLVVIFAMVKMSLAGRSPFSRAAGLLYAACALLQGGLQAVPFSVYLDHDVMPWLYGLNVVGSGLFAVAARVQARHIQAPDRRVAPARRPYSLLPWGAVAVVWALTGTLLALDGLTPRTWLVWGGTTVTTILVVVRQRAAFRHIEELLRERDELTARLTHLAYHDSLTGLANRGLFLQRLEEALAAGPVTVFHLDLDAFKPVNDAFGHAAGDRLLVEVGVRVRAAVRDGDLVARLGGDEFAVLAPELPESRRAALADILATALRGTVRIGTADVALSASIGHATGSAGTHDPDSLLHAADLAMYAAKDRRRERSQDHIDISR